VENSSTISKSRGSIPMYSLIKNEEPTSYQEAIDSPNYKE